MSKSGKIARRDKRARMDLELFVLALIDRGLNTPYDLLAGAGLSPSATIPVLGASSASASSVRERPARGEKRNTRLRLMADDS